MRIGRGWIAAVWCASQAMVEFASTRGSDPCRGDEIGKHSGLKIRRLTACRFKSGPRYQEAFHQIPENSLDPRCSNASRVFCFLEKPRSSVDLWGHLRGHVGVKNDVLEKKPPGGLHAPD